MGALTSSAEKTLGVPTIFGEVSFLVGDALFEDAPFLAGDDLFGADITPVKAVGVEISAVLSGKLALGVFCVSWATKDVCRLADGLNSILLGFNFDLNWLFVIVLTVYSLLLQIWLSKLCMAQPNCLMLRSFLLFM